MLLPPGTTHLTADDGTSLAVHVRGSGPPVVCLPGGPMLDSAYLGTLGGLDAHRTLVLADPRGTGASGTPADPTTYRCDRQVADVESVRRWLGSDRLDVLAHSAAANLAGRWAERHPDRIGRLVLVTPSVRAVGVEIADEARAAVARSRAGEPWYAEAAAALARVQAGSDDDADWDAIEPFTHGRWDDRAREQHRRMEAARDPALVAAFGADGAFDPAATRAALATLTCPVLVVAGDRDVGNPPGSMAEVAALFPRGELVVVPGAGHYPWVDDPNAFRAAVLTGVADSGP